MTRSFKLSFFGLISLLALLVLSGCGGDSTTATGSNSAPTATATTQKDTSKDYGNSGATPTTAPSSTGSTIKTASATVEGKSVTILTDAKGMTLYYFTPDTASKTACTDTCASTWPPLLSSSSKPTAEGKLSGELEIYPNANGKQVVYNDHPLYTYAGDSAAGQTNGQGVAGKWFVATPDLAKNKA